jgi:hypothetical protein
MAWKNGMYRTEERYIRGFVWDTLERRALGRRRSRWKDNITMDLQKMGCQSTDWIAVAQERGRCRALVNAVMNIRVP